MECYVITIMDNENSVSSAKRTIKSAQQFGKKVEHWKATTPKDNPQKIMEEKGIDSSAFKEVYSRHENCMAAFLSHYSLWERCAFENKDFLILEHDAVFVNHIPNTTMLEHVGTVGKPSYGKFNSPAHIGWGTLTQKHYFGGAHAYIVKPSGAWYLMEMAQKNPAPTDVFLNKTNFPWLQEWSGWPVEVKDTFTTIQKTEGCLAKHNYYKETYVIENVN